MGSQVKPLYKFGYWVHDPKTNDVKNHWEHRDGDVVHGSYSLMQPDGHLRVVDYTVDKHTGFNAHVKYVYEGHGGGGGGTEGFSNGGGGGGGGGGDFGSDYNNHLEDVSATGHSQLGSGGGGGHPKLLSKLYKKVRLEKPGGPPGQYKRPHHFDNRPKPVGGKQQRLPQQAEYSTEHYSKPSGHFDQLPKFPSSSGNPFGYPGDDLGINQPSSDHFARKYSSQASAEKSSYFMGTKHQSVERGLTHRQPDVTLAASTEHRQSSSEPHQLAPRKLELRQVTPQQLASQQLSPQQLAPQQLVSQQLAPQQLAIQQPVSPSRVQRLHNDQAKHDESTDNSSELQMDEPDSFVKMQKQQFKEYNFDEPPYPFEIPEKLSSITGKYQKRHSHQPTMTTSSYIPAGWSGSAAAKYNNEQPDDKFY